VLLIVKEQPAAVHTLEMCSLMRGGLQVAMYVRTRTLEEVLLMVKEHQGGSSTRMQISHACTLPCVQYHQLLACPCHELS
jgi:hypothetical protein